MTYKMIKKYSEGILLVSEDELRRYAIMFFHMRAFPQWKLEAKVDDAQILID